MEKNNSQFKIQLNNRPLKLEVNPFRQPDFPEETTVCFISEIRPALQKAAIARDHSSCCYCGFQSKKYQQVVLEGGNARDIDSVYTACPFCHQCFDLDAVAQMRSGVLIWLPEISQATLHHIARDIYRARITSGEQQDRARVILGRLLTIESDKKADSDKSGDVLSRRCIARQQLGTDDPAVLANKLRVASGRDAELSRVLEGIRLFPLGRRIIRESDLEFNQFPQILAYWRSKDGPFRQRDQFPWLATIEAALGFASPQADDAQKPGAGHVTKTPHKQLASKLLNDAATFFRTLAPQNADLETQMLENAEVFEKIAAMVAQKPDGRLLDTDDQGNPTHASRAGRLLNDAAGFFVTLADQHPAIAEQMRENANVYRQLAVLIETDPHGAMA